VALAGGWVDGGGLAEDVLELPQATSAASRASPLLAGPIPVVGYSAAPAAGCFVISA
jgi:hypothetical protein